MLKIASFALLFSIILSCIFFYPLKAHGMTYVNTGNMSVQGSKRALFINEVMAADNIINLNGYIELYNDSSSKINLKGYYLSNNPSDLKKWQFPDAVIGPYEILTVWIPEKKPGVKERIYTNFEIPPKDFTIMLTGADGSTIIDSIISSTITGKPSFGRLPDGSNNLEHFINPTPDSSNNNPVFQSAPSPGKPGIALTWDDDSIAEWHELLKFEWFNDTRNTFNLTQPYRLNADKWKKLHDIRLRGHEIACHGFEHVNALQYIKSYGMEAYLRNEIEPSLSAMKANGFNPISFAYPNGANNKMTDAALLQYFKVLRTTSYSPGGDLFKWGSTKVLPANGMDHNYPYTLDDYYSWLERAKSNNLVVILYGHTPTSETSGDYRTSHQRLEAIIKKAQQLNLTFYTLSELAADIGNLTVSFQPDISPLPEWSLDRKNWYAGGTAITLPTGKYTIMFRNIDNCSTKEVEIKKACTTKVIMGRHTAVNIY